MTNKNMKKFLLIICSSLFLLSACSNEDAQAKTKVQNEAKTEAIQASTDSIDSKNDKKSQTQSSESEQSADSDQIKGDNPLTADLSILIMGDSLSAGYRITLEQSWVTLLENDLEQDGKEIAITNGSISGETTGGGLARLDDLLARSQPDIVIIELGGNDGLRGYPVKSIRKNLETMIEKSRAAGAKVLLCGIMIPPNYGERYANAFAELYPTLSEELNIPLVPFILDGVALNDEMMQNDGIHPNEFGQPKIRDNVMTLLESIL